jgi:hypothetical protein
MSDESVGWGTTGVHGDQAVVKLARGDGERKEGDRGCESAKV